MKGLLAVTNTESLTPFKRVIRYFDLMHKKHYGGCSYVFKNKDARIIKDLLKVYDIYELRDMIDMFYTTKDKWIRQAETNWTVFAAKSNFLKQESYRSKKGDTIKSLLSPKAQATLEAFQTIMELEGREE